MDKEKLIDWLDEWLSETPTYGMVCLSAVVDAIKYKIREGHFEQDECEKCFLAEEFHEAYCKFCGREVKENSDG